VDGFYQVDDPRQMVFTRTPITKDHAQPGPSSPLSPLPGLAAAPR
jgi:hypothetical protein